MKHVYFRVLSVNLGVRDRLQYVFAHESKWILDYVNSVRSVYHIMSNTIHKIQKLEYRLAISGYTVFIYPDVLFHMNHADIWPVSAYMSTFAYLFRQL